MSTTGTAQNPVYNYDVTVTNTGTTPVGTFWMGWMPGEDFLPSVPSNVSSPNGWTSSLNGSGNSFDGTSIEWVASSNAIPTGQSLGGFDFSTTDSPAVLAGNSPAHAGTPALTSFVYSGGPFSDAGFSFVATAPSTPPPNNGIATTTSLKTSTASANAGDQVVLTATVTPSSGNVTPTGTVNFTIGGSNIGSAQVQSDGTAILNTTTLPAGSDSIIATYSGDSTYAGSASTALTETIQAPPALSASIARSTLPAELVSGAAAKGVVTLTVTNQSGSPLKGKATLTVFASTTDGIDASSIQLGQVVKNLNLPAGKQVSAVVPLHITSATFPTGSFKLFARATDPSGNAADSAAGEAVDVAAPFVALTETVVGSSLPTSATASSKAHGSAILAVTNNGNVTTSATTTAVLFATTNGTVDASAVQLVSVALPLRIKPGKTGRAVVSLKQIPTLAAGVYTVVAQLTDQNGAVSSVTVGALTITA